MHKHKLDLKPVVTRVYDRLGYSLDKEVLDVLTSYDQHKIIRAPAGGTKTTMTQFMVNLYKMVYLIEGTAINEKITSNKDRVDTVIPEAKLLCLVYNKHNVEDIKNVHARFYGQLMDLGLFSPEVTRKNYTMPGVTASTVHGFGEKVIRDNLKFLNLKSFALAKDEIIRAQFKSVVNKVMEKSSLTVTPALIKDIKTLYDLYVNLLLYKTPEDQPLTDSIQFELVLSSMDVPSKYLREIFSSFDRRKTLLKLWEYSDQLRLAEKILSNPTIQETYKKKFNTIVADEIQDFTPIMVEVLKNIIGEETKTICVGDDNQSIYSFSGAIIEGVANFSKYLNIEAKYFTLTTNRRCRAQTLPYAINVISEVAGESAKDIRPLKQDGSLERHLYADEAEQIDLAYKLVMKNTVGTTGVLFRRKVDSILFSRYLYLNGVSANYINAYNCMSHGIYKMFIEMIQQLFIDKTLDGLKMLNRILPFSREKIDTFLGYDSKKGIFEKCPDPAHWASIDFSPMYDGSRNYISINDQVTFVKKVAKEISFSTAAEIAEPLLDMFYKNYYQFVADDDPLAELVLSWAKKDLSMGYNFSTTLDKHATMVYKTMGSSKTIAKLNVSTMHGTKGLEFNHVIIGNVESQLKKNQASLSPAALAYLEAEENRLYYVAATRQIDSLNVLCSKENPHRLGDEKYFKTEDLTIEGPKFSNDVSNLFGGTIADSAPARKGRRSKILEE